MSPVALVFAFGLPAISVVDGGLTLGRYAVIVIVTLALAAAVERARGSARLLADRARWQTVVALLEASATTWLLWSTAQWGRGEALVAMKALWWVPFFAGAIFTARVRSGIAWPPAELLERSDAIATADGGAP